MRSSKTAKLKPASSPTPKIVKTLGSLGDGKRVLEIEARAVQALIDRMDSKFAKAVDLLAQCTGKVVVSGMGKSGLIGQKIAATLASTGTSSFFLHPAEGVHGDLGMLARRDALIAISNSGETQELLQLLPYVRRMGIPIVSLTGRVNSNLAKNSDVTLDVSVAEEACPMGLAPTASTTAMLVMGDALAMAVLQARGFKQSEFARHHPAGAIGRALLLHVHDIMRTGARNAVAPHKLSVKEALLVMTRAKSGSVSVVNSRGKLMGVFTDGDLRRRMADDEHVLSKPLATVMTRNPICIREDALAVEALKIFNERNIDDIIVVNAKREPMGLVDSQDLPKLKLM